MRVQSAACMLSASTLTTLRLFSSMVRPDSMMASQQSNSSICRQLSVPPLTWMMLQQLSSTPSPSKQSATDRGYSAMILPFFCGVHARGSIVRSLRARRTSLICVMGSRKCSTQTLGQLSIMMLQLKQWEICCLLSRKAISLDLIPISFTVFPLKQASYLGRFSTVKSSLRLRPLSLMTRMPRVWSMAWSIFSKCLPPITPMQSILSLRACSVVGSLVCTDLTWSSFMIWLKEMPLELRYISMCEITSAPSSTILFLESENSKLSSMYLLKAKCQFSCIRLEQPEPVSFFLRMWLWRLRMLWVACWNWQSKQEWHWRWQKGFSLFCTMMLRQSLSQSYLKDWISCVFPLYSPFFISRFSFREQRCNSLVSQVILTASASMNTSPSSFSEESVMMAGQSPSSLKLISWLQRSAMGILRFQMAEPSCGTALGKPQMYLRSSREEIPPAMMTLSMGPGTWNMMSRNWLRGMPARCPSLWLKVRLTVLTPSYASSAIFAITFWWVLTVLAWVSTSLSWLMDSSTIILSETTSVVSWARSSRLVLRMTLGMRSWLRQKWSSQSVLMPPPTPQMLLLAVVASRLMGARLLAGLSMAASRSTSTILGSSLMQSWAWARSQEEWCSDSSLLLTRVGLPSLMSMVAISSLFCCVHSDSCFSAVTYSCGMWGWKLSRRS